MESSTDLTLPCPPFLEIDGIANFRDIGGYSISSSNSRVIVKRGFVYRCADPSKVTTEGLAIIRSLGITHFYDLRSLKELKKDEAENPYANGKWNVPERVFAPVFEDRDYSPEALAIRFNAYAQDGTAGFVRAYTDILNAAPSSYRQILLHVANNPNSPLVIHCTAGKDRTGVICALLLSLCGVDDETVSKEYALTDLGLAHVRSTWIDHLANGPALAGNRKGAENMISARYDNMMATLSVLRDEFGGPEAYVKGKCGLLDQDIENIRSNLTCQEPAISTSLGQL